jgi:hypothetical protein
MSHADSVVARVWRHARSERNHPEAVLEDALASALEDGSAWPRLVAHFGWALPTALRAVTRQDRIDTGRTDLRLTFHGGEVVVLELKAWGSPTIEQLTRYATEPEVRVLGIARYLAVRSGAQVEGCVTWSALVALPWPNPPLPWRQFRALTRTMGVAVPQVDLPALSGLVASYDAHLRYQRLAREAAERVHRHVAAQGAEWRFKTATRGRRWVERKWRRHVGWCWVAPYNLTHGAGIFAGLSFGRPDVPLIVPGLPDLILAFNVNPQGPLGGRVAADADLGSAVKRWLAIPTDTVREFDGGRWEQVRVRAPATRLLEAPDADRALLDWVDQEMIAWRECGLLDAIAPIVAGVTDKDSQKDDPGSVAIPSADDDGADEETDL